MNIIRDCDLASMLKWLSDRFGGDIWGGDRTAVDCSVIGGTVTFVLYPIQELDYIKHVREQRRRLGRIYQIRS
jgi:hypothetical protein